MSLPAFGLDFSSAYALAKKNDPDIQAAEFGYQASQEARPEARSALLPQVNLGVFYRHIRDKTENSSNTTFNPNRTIKYETDGYSLTLDQPLYRYKLYMQLDQARLTEALGLAQVESARQDLIVRVAEAYYNVLYARDNLKYAVAEKEAIARQLEQTKKRFEVGLIAITDVKESQAKYDLAVAQEISAQNSLANSKEALRSVIAQEPDKLMPVGDSLPLLVPDPQSIDEWVSSAKQNNLALKAAELSYKIAQKAVKANRADHYPTLDLQLAQDYTSPNGGSLYKDTTDTSISVQLNVPIYSGGRTSAKVREAVANKEKARAERDKALRATIQSTRNAYLGLTTSIAQVKALKQALVSTQTAYEATQAGFEVGTRTAVEVLAALREQYKSERDYSQARYDYIINLLRLKQAAGILGEEDVAAVNQWLGEAKS